MTPGQDTAKRLGAYYTATMVADFLVAWAVRSPDDVVMDPGFGDGVFLRAACTRLAALGGNPTKQVMGVEIDPAVHAHALETLGGEFGLAASSLLCSDFFKLEPGSKTAAAVVGNPPFIRYQRFNGNARKLALRRALSQGVRLSGLSSSWAPFLVHATSMVEPGGRLAMVLPFELAHAGYARPVLEHVGKTFGRTTIVTFEERVFRQLSEDTLLVLAENKGARRTQCLWRHLQGAEELGSLLDGNGRLGVKGTRLLDYDGLSKGQQRLVEYFVPADVRRLYQELRHLQPIRRLGDLAYVGIGYVTGANDFFHLTPFAARLWGIPAHMLRPAVRRARALRGLRFTTNDWNCALSAGDAGYLLRIEQSADLPEGVVRYLEEGRRLGVPSAYKCRARPRWYSVPQVRCPSAFLTYMSGHAPKLVANVARAVAPNTLHVVHLYDGCRLTGECLALLWQTSLTRLSAEVEGHALGGGMLKLEPKEARNVLLPVVEIPGMMALVEEIDQVCRKLGTEEATKAADEIILREGLGLSGAECELLRTGAERLRNRRYGKSERRHAG
jgi:adenine-specific DNA-methyltransferase